MSCFPFQRTTSSSSERDKDWSWFSTWIRPSERWILRLLFVQAVWTVSCCLMPVSIWPLVPNLSIKQPKGDHFSYQKDIPFPLWTYTLQNSRARFLIFKIFRHIQEPFWSFSFAAQIDSFFRRVEWIHLTQSDVLFELTSRKALRSGNLVHLLKRTKTKATFFSRSTNLFPTQLCFTWIELASWP